MTYFEFLSWNLLMHRRTLFRIALTIQFYFTWIFCVLIFHIKYTGYKNILLLCCMLNGVNIHLARVIIVFFVHCDNACWTLPSVDKVNRRMKCILARKHNTQYTFFCCKGFVVKQVVNEPLSASVYFYTGCVEICNQKPKTMNLIVHVW